MHIPRRLRALKKHRILIAIIICYILFGSIVLYAQYHYITDYKYDLMGNDVLHIAQITAASLEITNEDVATLVDMEFKDTIEHPLNQKLENLFSSVKDRNSLLKYAYIIRKLPDDRIRYWVNEEDSGFYQLPEGTPLNYIWLLDVVIDPDLKENAVNTFNYYKDKNRYTYKTGEITSMLEQRSTDYLLLDDEWGTQISGLAPIYTTEGDYVGLLGIDMFSSMFLTYRSTILWTLILLVVVPTIFLSFIYLILHLNYRRKMNFFAYHDQLTQCYNRRYFDEMGRKQFEFAKENHVSMQIVIGDIDDFKVFNDYYGHQMGDAILIQVATILKSILKEMASNGFVARYGGEEFVLICQNNDLDKICKYICSSIQKPMMMQDDQEFRVTISLGGYEGIPTKDDRLEDYLKLADQALYDVKRSGKCNYKIENEYAQEGLVKEGK